MATVARLNQVASRTLQSTRKRPRAPDEQDTASAKRQATEQVGIQLRSGTRKSATRLRSRDSLPASTPTRQPRTTGVYDVQESPKVGRGKDSPKDQPQARGRPAKKKRLLNRKGEKKTTEVGRYDQKRRSIINPLKVSGVTLTTYDSPAKNTRARRELPLKKLHLDFVTPVAVDAEEAEGTDPTARQDVTIQSSSFQDAKHGDRGTGETEVDETDQEIIQEKLPGEEQSPGRDEDTSGETDEGNAEREGRPDPIGSNHDDPSKNNQTWTSKLSDQDRNFLRRQYEGETEKQKQLEIEAGKKKKRDSSAKTRENSSQNQTKPKHVQAQASQEEVRQEEPSESENNEAEEREDVTTKKQTESRKRDRRPRLTKEEKLAKKEAEARRRQENAIETAEAEIEHFEARAEEFVRDIEDLTDQVGGTEAWSRTGAAAVTISAMAGKKEKMGEARAQAIWNKLRKLRDIFSGKEEANEEWIAHNLKSLQNKATWGVLTNREEVKPGDSTIIDLYEQLIPQSVYLLRKALKGRFVPMHKVSWEELQTLVGVAISLCNVAKDWQPRPSTLDTGIRRSVHQDIKPNLVIIQNVITDTMNMMELKEKRRREHAMFTKLQQRKRQEKIEAWEKIRRDCPTRELPKPAGYVVNGGTAQQQMDDNDIVVHAQGDSIILPSSNRVRPTASLLRQQTEEIPAPDPSTHWSEKENIALLNGLQRYTGENRYTRVLQDPEFAQALSEKDVDQCIARAKFYQAGFGQTLKEKLEKGDSSFDWLRSV